MTEVAAAPRGAAAAPPALARPTSDPPSRADSASSALSHGSGACSEQAGCGSGSAPTSVGAVTPHHGSMELDGAAPSGASHDAGPAGPGSTLQRAGSAAAPGAVPKRDGDAKSSALKALAGVSAVVSKSRKVDAEALHAIKSQRARARAEGHPPGGLSAGGSLPVPGSGGAPGRVTPPAAPLAGAVDGGAGVSPFSAATIQGVARAPSASSVAAGLGGSAAPSGTALCQATSLPIAAHAGQRGRRPCTTPPSCAADYEALVSRMSISELVALKKAVECQLARQTAALAPPASARQPPQDDVLSQQYAALLLQNAQQAQQAQLAQQLSSQQQAAHAAAIQQALSAAAAAAGVAPPSPEQLLLGGPAGALSAGGAGPASIPSYHSMPLPDMATPFASAPFPADAGFGGGDALTTPLPQRAFGAPGKAASGSPRSASAEQHLIGEALYSFLDPERQGPASLQGSALVNGINWSDRTALAAGGAAFARSRSLPQPQEGLLQDRAAPLSQRLDDGGDPQLPSLFSSLHVAESLSRQQGQQALEGGVLPTAFAPARSGSLHAPLPGHAVGAVSQPHIVFADSVLPRAYQLGY